MHPPRAVIYNEIIISDDKTDAEEQKSARQQEAGSARSVCVLN